NVLFVYPDFNETVGGTQQHGSYSEGIGSLSAVLKRAGHGVDLLHLTSDISKDDYSSEIMSRDCDLVAFSARTSIFPYVRNYAAWTKQVRPDDGPNPVVTLCGGYHATMEPQETIEVDGMDAVCIGEGEGPIVDLCDRLDARESYSDVKSLWVKADGEIVRNEVRPLLEDLDELPVPDLGLFDFENLSASRIKTANVMLSRGCPYKCTYCCNHQFKAVYPNKNKYARFMSPERAITYLAKLRADYPFIRYINFMDNILPMKKKWFYEFVEGYKTEIGLPFSCRFRADLMTREVVAALKDAGCYLVHFGVESGDDYIRNDILQRNMKREKIIQAFDTCRELGLSALSYNMINLPHEGMGEILSTIKLNARLKPDRVVDTIFYPYPNTKLYEIAVEAGFLEPCFDYREEIPLEQPKLSRPEVLFAQRYFRTFIRIYRLVERLPRFLRKAVERGVDKIFLTKMKPHGLLVGIANARLSATVGFKRFLMKRTPSLYLYLRDMVVRKSD
ncbi:MAG: B12-binding domain-containing radical SAM protein, partial [Terriglobia bacterium]